MILISNFRNYYRIIFLSNNLTRIVFVCRCIKIVQWREIQISKIFWAPAMRNKILSEITFLKIKNIRVERGASSTYLVLRSMKRLLLLRILRRPFSSGYVQYIYVYVQYICTLYTTYVSISRISSVFSEPPTELDENISFGGKFKSVVDIVIVLVWW